MPPIHNTKAIMMVVAYAKQFKLSGEGKKITTKTSTNWAPEHHSTLQHPGAAHSTGTGVVAGALPVGPGAGGRRE